MSFLDTRSSEIEIMDDFSCSGEVLHQTLRELQKINTLLGGDHISISGIKKLAKLKKGSSVTVVDLGCGGGDTMKLMADSARSDGQDTSFTGVDANPNIVAYAEENTLVYDNITFLTTDIFGPEFKAKKFDIAHCSLFTHHFPDDELVTLFKQLMDQVSIGIVVNDLHRHVISYYFTKWIIKALSKSTMVQNDSVVSVARSFKKRELKSILQKAGITNYSLKWRWAYRWELIIYK